MAASDSHPSLPDDADLLDPETLQPGQVLAGRFSIVRALGRGAMGLVFLATDQQLQAPVVIKLMMADMTHEPESLELFRREVVSARAVAHPNVIRVFDYHLLHGVPAMTMEHLPGGSLREKMDQPERDLVWRLRALAQVAEGLHAAHSAGVIHRDIKPANVLFGDDGSARLTDFGIARRASARESTVPRYTPYYAAPEQIRGQALTAQTDLYSLGAMAFHVLCGRPPFQGVGTTILDGHLGGAVPSPRSIQPAIPPAANDILLRCLEKNPANRPGTAMEVARALRQAALEAEPRRDAAVLFIDLVAFSALATQSQGSAVQAMNRIVTRCPSVSAQSGEDLIKLPTGDGLALVFLTDHAAAYTAGLEITQAMRERDLHARMGLHVGSVQVVSDVNEQRNVTGSGINTCQRVMSCGQAGHLLCSDEFRTRVLKEHPNARRMFKGPFQATVKHGLQVTLWNIHGEGVGRAEPPVVAADSDSATLPVITAPPPAEQTIRTGRHKAPAPSLAAPAPDDDEEEALPSIRPRTPWIMAGALGAVVLAGVGFMVMRPAEPVVSSTPAAVVAPAEQKPVAQPKPAEPPQPVATEPAAAPAPVEKSAVTPPAPAEEAKQPVERASRPVRNKPAAVRVAKEAPAPEEKSPPAEEKSPPVAEKKPEPVAVQPAPSEEKPAPEEPKVDPAVRAREALAAAQRAMYAGRFGEAETQALLAAKLDPSAADPHKLLANVYALQKRHCDARTHFLKFIVLAPSSPIVKGIRQRLSQPEYAACR